MNDGINKQDGFLGQKMFVLPPAIRHELEMHALGNLLYITDIGYFPKAKHHMREREIGASEHILIFCIEGKGKVHTPENTIPLGANEFCLIKKGTPHTYDADSNNPWSIYWIHFDGTKADDICQTIPLHASISLRSTEKEGRIGMFNDFFQILEKGITSERVLYISMQLWSLLSSFAFSSLYANGQDLEQNRIEEAIHYMKTQIQSTLTLEEMAQHIQTSSSHFSSIFKNNTGHSPLNYFILLKMQEACRLLSLSGMSIKHIAFHLNYNDPYYFSRIFKKTIGLSPREYRQSKS